MSVAKVKVGEEEEGKQKTLQILASGVVCCHNLWILNRLKLYMIAFDPASVVGVTFRSILPLGSLYPRSHGNFFKDFGYSFVSN